jgi:hypothetical protein
MNKNSIDSSRAYVNVELFAVGKSNLFYLGNRLDLEMFTQVYGRQHYSIPPDKPDSNIKIDLTSMAFQKGSHLTNHFSHL